MKPAKLLAIGVCVLAACAISCETDIYEIKMTPRNDVMVRELTAYRAGEGGPASQPATQPQKLDDAKLEPLVKAYGKSVSKPEDARQVFVGEFKGRMPQDIGGYGTYKRIPSDLGAACLYVEQFRGSDKPAARLDEIGKGIDNGVDLLIGWFEAELGKEKGFDQLRTYLDKDIRSMLHDVKLYYYFGSANPQAASQPFGNELWVRTAVRVMQADLIELQALVELVGSGSMSDQALQKALAMAQRKAAEKMGVPADKPVPASLAFLGDFDKAKASLEKYARTTKYWPEYAKAVAKERAEAATRTSQPSPAPSTTQASQPAESLDGFLNYRLSGHLAEAVAGSTGATENLKLAMELPVKPVKTNGDWDGKAVVWTFTLSGSDSLAWPRLAYAAWAQPDKKEQERLFGQVVLDGENLLDYVAKRTGMSKEQSAAWEKRLGCVLTPAAYERWKSAEGNKDRSYGDYLMEDLRNFLNPPSTQPTQPTQQR